MDDDENNGSMKYLLNLDFYPFSYLRDSLDPNYPIDDVVSLLGIEKNEDEPVSLSKIIDNPKLPSDIIQNIKKPNSKSPKFETHYCFNPKLKNNEKGIKNKKLPTFLTTNINTKRKRDKDNITKKIKTKFFGSLKKVLKDKIEIKNKRNKNKDKKAFKFIPQKFITNIKKENNKTFWEETLLEFCEEKLEKGNKALELIKEDKIGEIKFKDLYNDYLNSQEFEDDLQKIKSEKNADQNYIDDYVNNAKDFINYFLLARPKKKKKTSQ